MDAPSPPVMRIAISPAKARNREIFLCKIKFAMRDAMPAIFFKLAKYEIASTEKRNVAVVGGKELEVVDFKPECVTVHNSTRRWTPNQVARFRLFDAFLSGRENISKVKSHLVSNRLLSYMYQNITASQNGEVPYSKILL